MMLVFGEFDDVDVFTIVTHTVCTFIYVYSKFCKKGKSKFCWVCHSLIGSYNNGYFCDIEMGLLNLTPCHCMTIFCFG